MPRDPVKSGGRHQLASQDLTERLNAIGNLETAELRNEWVQLFRSQPPKRITRDLLTRAVAYELQTRVHGGLTRSEQKTLAALAQSTHNTVRPEIKVGTRLLRQWQGVTHEVLVAAAGYEWKGQTYKSLSQIARLITGTRWSGPRFFGLKA